jgi:hypothetical protein
MKGVEFRSLFSYKAPLEGKEKDETSNKYYGLSVIGIKKMA